MDELERSQPGITYFNLITKVRKSIGTDAVQTPQLHGDINRPIFLVHQSDGNLENVSVSAKPYVLVAHTTGDKITISAGLVHGVTKGSIYAVYSPAEMRFAEGGLAKIQISEVALDTSTAICIEGSMSSITPRCRAIETQHAFARDNLYLYIGIDGNQADEFIRHLGVENVVIVSDEQIADFIFRLVPDFGTITGKLIAADGRIVSQVSGESVEELAGKLRRTIEREVLIKLLRSFRNPNPPFDLKVWVDKSDDAIYKIGETISMAFRAEKDCYLILLNVDSEGYVTMMFPNKYHLDNKITGGQIYTIPSSNMQFKIRTQGPPGRELVMALATTERISIQIFQTEKQSEIFPDLTGAKLGTELIRILSQSLQEGNITSSSISLPSNKWVTDSLIIVLSP